MSVEKDVAEIKTALLGYDGQSGLVQAVENIETTLNNPDDGLTAVGARAKSNSRRLDGAEKKGWAVVIVILGGAAAAAYDFFTRHTPGG